MDYKCLKCGGWLNTGYRCQCGKWSPPPVETSAGTCTPPVETSAGTYTVGTPVSRKEALEIASNILVNAESARIKYADAMADDLEHALKPNAQIGGGTPSAPSDCSDLRKRIADLEQGMKEIAHWTQEDQDDQQTCVMQWRGCVAIARKLLKTNASLSIPGGEPGYAPGDCSAGILFKDAQTMRTVKRHEKDADAWWCEGVDEAVGLWNYSTRFILNHLLPNDQAQI